MKTNMKTLIQTAVLITSLAMNSLAMAADTGGSPSEGVININTATVDELTLLPGIGPSKAEAIVKQRARQPFKTTDQLMRVKGIGRKTFKNLQPWLRVEGPTTLKSKIRLERASDGGTNTKGKPAAQ